MNRNIGKAERAERNSANRGSLWINRHSRACNSTESAIKLSRKCPKIRIYPNAWLVAFRLFSKFDDEKERREKSEMSRNKQIRTEVKYFLERCFDTMIISVIGREGERERERKPINQRSVEISRHLVRAIRCSGENRATDRGCVNIHDSG